jgi:hypothetical protein
MTKKSASRIAKDQAARAAGHEPMKFSDRLSAAATLEHKKEAYYQHNTCWDDVQDIAAQCASLLPQYAGVAAALANPKIQANLENFKRTVNNVHVLSSTLRSLHTELQGIRADHAGKFGHANPEDHVKAIGIHQRYLAWMERHNALITPVFTTICEDIQNAEIRIKQAEGSESFSHELTENVGAVLAAVDEHLADGQARLTEAQDPAVVSDAVVTG